MIEININFIFMKIKLSIYLNMFPKKVFNYYQNKCYSEISEETPIDKERYAKQTYTNYTKKVYNYSDISGDNNIVLQNLNSPNQNISTVNIISIHGNNNIVLQNSNIANLINKLVSIVVQKLIKSLVVLQHKFNAKKRE